MEKLGKWECYMIFCVNFSVHPKLKKKKKKRLVNIVSNVLKVNLKFRHPFERKA